MTSPIKGFRIVSPGVAFREIDNSGLTQINTNSIGPVVIGRAAKGPAMRPVVVRDLEEFIRVFGTPQAGTINGGDVWRKGSVAAPTYGAYAAEAWLKSSTPLTFVRLLGDESPNATSGGKAGWQTDASLSADQAANGGAYGLFIVDDQGPNTGSLAAVFYLQEGSVTLKGTDRDGNTDVTGSSVMIKSTGANKTFRAVIKDADNTVKLDTEFNFTPSSDKFIRKVFNTNPMLTNADLFDSNERKTYWLGSTYEKNLDKYVTGSTAGLQLGVVLGLAGSHSGNVDGGFYRFGMQSAKTGWFFGQDLNAASSTYEPRTMPKLFRLHSLYGGESDNSNIKISIMDIKASNNPDDPYGTFTVVVRQASDVDSNPVIIESFTNLNLNPSSPNFIAARIGDKNLVWDDNSKSYIEYGMYDNASRHIRVELEDNVAEGLHNPYLLPFGVYGPERHRPFAIISGAVGPVRPDETDTQTQFTASFVKGAGSIAQSSFEGNEFVNVGSTNLTASFVFPSLSLRQKATDGGLPNPKKAHYGVVTSRAATSTAFDEGYGEYNKPLSGDYRNEQEGEYVEYSWIFTLDDVSGSSVSPNDVTAPGEYVSGSRKAMTSLSAVYGWESVLDNNHNRFTTCMAGGFDGVDITEMDPFRNSLIPSLPTETNSSVYYTYKKAIDMVRSAEVIDHNLAVVPGLTNEGLTSYLGRVCKERGDSLSIIDPKGGYVPRSESSESSATRNGTTSAIVANMKSRGENNSYMAAYDPWVIAKDTFSGARVVLPPSVVALGAMATTDKTFAPWFAPAGFVRGGLTNGAAGIAVVGTTRHLLGDDRDALYAVGVNSIAKFPQQGIVIWGEKTLQSYESATDRVNVRRLMNYIKKVISNIANQVLFEPNVEATWNSFKAKAEIPLKDAQARFGINTFKLTLDSSTTTQEVVDNNAIYAKIEIQPTKTVEFIAIDFVITNNAVGFND